MKEQQIRDLMCCMESMESLAGDLIDGVAVIRAEIEQMFHKMEGDGAQYE